MSSSSSSSATSGALSANSLLRIAMPVASTLILAYYIVTLPMSFMGGGSSSEQLLQATSKVEVVAPAVQPAKMQQQQQQQQLPSPKLQIPQPQFPSPKLQIPQQQFPAPKLQIPSPKGVEMQVPKTEKPAKVQLPAGGKSEPMQASKGVQSGSESVVQQTSAGGNLLKEEEVSHGRTEQLPLQGADDEIWPRFDDVDVDAETGLARQVFRSFDVFKKNYREMEKRFKVFIYPDGDPNTYFQTPRKLTGKYASEGYFFQNLRESKFVTRNPNKAHLFFLPISCHKMRGKGISYDKMADTVQEYVEGLIVKYPYWNRTLGADHFFATCHDVGVRATKNVAHLVKNSIRVVCSPSYNGDFIPHKDVAMPQILQPFALARGGGQDIKNRTTLGFWAGHRNSKIRVTLAKLWENDDVLDISNNRISRAIGELVYQKQFYRSKFCICPGGSQVNSARLADSIHYGCVPVILSDFFDLPFNDVLDWSKFAVLLRERDVTELKTKLLSIPREQYFALHKGLLQVQDRFEWHSPPKPYDTFHMIMYELWLRHFTVQYKK